MNEYRNPRERRRDRIRAELLKDDPTLSGEDLAIAVDEAVEDEEYTQACEDAAMGYSTPEDSPTAANCNDWGTGEGQYHGRF